MSNKDTPNEEGQRHAVVGRVARMGMAHTPGPWTFALFDDEPNASFVQWRAGCAAVYGSRAGREANALLIASAPELLEALVDVLSYFDSPEDGCFSDERLARVRSAVAKATGASAP